MGNQRPAMNDDTFEGGIFVSPFFFSRLFPLGALPPGAYWEETKRNGVCKTARGGT